MKATQSYLQYITRGYFRLFKFWAQVELQFEQIRFKRLGDRGGVVLQLLESSPLYASKQQRLRRLRKRYLKVKSRCFKLFRAFSISYRSSNAGIFFVELNSRRLLGVQENEKESSCLVFTSSTKREIRQFHVVVLQWRQRRVQNACCTCRVAVLPI